MSKENEIKTNRRDDWRLKKLELEFQSFGEHKGKYCGSIYFQNGDFESFQFKIRPDMAEPYIDLIAADIIQAAGQLTERLVQSLGLRDR